MPTETRPAVAARRKASAAGAPARSAAKPIKPDDADGPGRIGNPTIRSTGVKRWAWSWSVALFAAWAHVLVLTVLAGMGTAAALLLFAAPGLITLWRVPASRRRWYRWVAVWVLPNIVVGELWLFVLLFAEAWALHQSWTYERTTSPRGPSAVRTAGLMPRLPRLPSPRLLLAKGRVGSRSDA